MTHKKIVIVGGGPVGLSMAIKLAKQGKAVSLIDQGLTKANDARVLALSHASYVTLNGLQAWPNDCTAINCVQISHQGLGVAQITAPELKLNQLGFTVKYASVCAKLEAIANAEPLIQLILGNVITVHDGAEFATICYSDANNAEQILGTDLLIMAEGG